MVGESLGESPMRRQGHAPGHPAQKTGQPRYAMEEASGGQAVHPTLNVRIEVGSGRDKRSPRHYLQAPAGSAEERPPLPVDPAPQLQPFVHRNVRTHPLFLPSFTACFLLRPRPTRMLSALPPPFTCFPGRESSSHFFPTSPINMPHRAARTPDAPRSATFSPSTDVPRPPAQTEPPLGKTPPPAGSRAASQARGTAVNRPSTRSRRTKGQPSSWVKKRRSRRSRASRRHSSFTRIRSKGKRSHPMCQ